ncbi:unnamed protein product [marine sediment metagenome]|uniref:Uncharacterized protein n=1 Tax=marine sediment metagenome TaxID=412755 RepID=X1KA39_9ZZZZ
MKKVYFQKETPKDEGVYLKIWRFWFRQKRIRNKCHIVKKVKN